MSCPHHLDGIPFGEHQYLSTPHGYVCSCGHVYESAKTLEQQMKQMRCALEEIRDNAVTTKNGGAWAAGVAMLCLGTLGELDVAPRYVWESGSKEGSR